MEISEQVITIFDDIGERLGIAIDWSQENVLPYLQELFEKYINFEIASSIMWIALFSLGTAVFSVLGFIIFRHFDKTKDEWALGLGTAMVFCAVFFFIALIVGLFVQVYDIITCLTFPEKMIIDAFLKPME